MNSIKIEGWAKIKIAFRYNERERGGPFACFPANLERLSVDGGSTVALPPPFFFFSSFKIIAHQTFEITFRSINSKSIPFEYRAAICIFQFKEMFAKRADGTFS